MGKDHNQKPLKEAIENFLKVYKLDRKYNQVEVSKAWSAVMGDYIQSKTKSIYLSGTVLRIRLVSSVISEEILYKKTETIVKLNAEIGRILIEDITFVD